MAPENTALPVYTKKDFESGVDPRWCPGCGDFSIINQVQKALPNVGVARENIVFVSGIGCSSRFFPTAGSAFCTWLMMEKSPQPGHHLGSTPDSKSFLV
jgi:hypothetical protein